MTTTIAAPQPWQPLQWCEQLRCELLASEHISPWHRGEVVNAMVPGEMLIRKVIRRGA